MFLFFSLTLYPLPPAPPPRKDVHGEGSICEDLWWKSLTNFSPKNCSKRSFSEQLSFFYICPGDILNKHTRLNHPNSFNYLFIHSSIHLFFYICPGDILNKHTRLNHPNSFNYLSIYLFIYLFTYIFIYSLIYSFINPFYTSTHEIFSSNILGSTILIYLFIHVFVVFSHLFIDLFDQCFYIDQFIYLFIDLSVYLLS